MLPTPTTDHISASVYPPAEDSFLLLDTLSLPQEQDFLARRFRQSSKVPFAVEVGTGSGVVLAFLTANAKSILGQGYILAMGVDVNASACHAAERTLREHCQEVGGAEQSNFLGCVRGDLASAIRPFNVDLLVFNPPYVPSEAVSSTNESLEQSRFEQDNALLAIATDGGANGMEVTDRLLNTLPDILSQQGVAYILFCKRNKPEEVINRIRNWETGAQWTADIVKETGKTGGFEKLSIVRIARIL